MRLPILSFRIEKMISVCIRSFFNIKFRLRNSVFLISGDLQCIFRFFEHTSKKVKLILRCDSFGKRVCSCERELERKICSYLRMKPFGSINKSLLGATDMWLELTSRTQFKTRPAQCVLILMTCSSRKES